MNKIHIKISVPSGSNGFVVVVEIVADSDVDVFSGWQLNVFKQRRCSTRFGNWKLIGCSNIIRSDRSDRFGRYDDSDPKSHPIDRCWLVCS